MLVLQYLDNDFRFHMLVTAVEATGRITMRPDGVFKEIEDELDDNLWWNEYG